MQDTSPLATVRVIMNRFAEQTGLNSNRPPRRYLWTDAFAVCNFLELYQRTGDEAYRNLALRLVEQVHHVLGRHHDDDPRSGWISGLDEADGRQHPTRGGLRIGKKLPERRPDDRFDERLEWEREGQYFHYLTKWMHALHRISQATGDATYNLWARELAEAAHAGFVYTMGREKRMYWKMSVDLSRPQVPSMGHHDPLDGFLVYSELQTLSPATDTAPTLEDETADMASIMAGKNWATDDALGLGGLLTDAYRAAQLQVAGVLSQPALPGTLLQAALAGLQSYLSQQQLQLPAAYRLAFRELGLSIGLHAVAQMRHFTAEHVAAFSHQQKSDPLPEKLFQLAPLAPLAHTIEQFWLDAGNQAASTWTDHPDINQVMLATSLAPRTYLTVLANTPAGA